MKTRILMVAVLALVATCAFAATDTAGQAVTFTVDEIAALNIAGALVPFTVTSPGHAGAGLIPVVSGPQASTSLIYTSVVPAATSRVIDAQVSVGAVPTGLNLNIVSAAPTGTGTVGSATGGANFTNASLGSTNMVTSVGSCYTGTAATNGAVLTYTLSILPGSANMSALHSPGGSCTIMYTLQNPL